MAVIPDQARPHLDAKGPQADSVQTRPDQQQVFFSLDHWLESITSFVSLFPFNRTNGSDTKLQDNLNFEMSQPNLPPPCVDAPSKQDLLYFMFGIIYTLTQELNKINKISLKNIF